MPSRQRDEARTKWLGNRHAGEPSPARLLKIPSQKGVGEVGGGGVPGAVDWVGSSAREVEHPGSIVIQITQTLDLDTAPTEGRGWPLWAAVAAAALGYQAYERPLILARRNGRH